MRLSEQLDSELGDLLRVKVLGLRVGGEGKE